MMSLRGLRPRHAGLGTALIAIVAVAAFGSALSQTQPRQRQLRMIKAGDTCDRKTDKSPGIVKVDACGRWYCGKTAVKDIIEVRPKFAEEFGCTWRLEGERCKCRRDPAATEIRTR